MSDCGQIPLKFPEVHLVSERWPELLELVRMVAVDVGRKTVADELDLSRSVLDNILLDRDRHALKARHLMYFILRDRSGRILALLAEMSGRRVEPRRELTADEKVRAYERAIRRRLGDFGDELLAEALQGAG